MLTLATILLVASLVTLILAAIPVSSTRPNLLALGLAFLVASQLVLRIGAP